MSSNYSTEQDLKDRYGGILESPYISKAHRHILDGFKVCYHTELAACACRKPKPGMLLEAANEWSIDLTQSFMVGDRWRDIEAGNAAGCKTILIKADYKEKKAENSDAVCVSLFEASQLILSGFLTRGEVIKNELHK